MKKLSAIVLLLLLPASAFATCDSAYQKKFDLYQHRLKKFHKTGKIIMGGGFAAGAVPTGLFFGTLFYGLTDGATIAASVLTGSLFGAVGGAAVAGAAGVGVGSYEIFLRTERHSYKRMLELLAEVERQDVNGKRVNQLFKKVKDKRPDLTIELFIQELENANRQELLCANANDPLRFHGIKKLLTGDHTEAPEAESDELSSND